MHAFMTRIACSIATYLQIISIPYISLSIHYPDHETKVQDEIAVFLIFFDNLDTTGEQFAFLYKSTKVVLI